MKTGDDLSFPPKVLYNLNVSTLLTNRNLKSFFFSISSELKLQIQLVIILDA